MGSLDPVHRIQPAPVAAAPKLQVYERGDERERPRDQTEDKIEIHESEPAAEPELNEVVEGNEHVVLDIAV